MSYRGGNSQQFLAVQIFERCSHFHFHSKRKSSRPDFWKGVHIFNFFKSQIWPFRFLKGVLIFILFQIANLNRSYRNTCSHFHFFSKRKSGRPDFWKGVHIFVFDENQNVNTFPVQICTEKVFTF